MFGNYTYSSVVNGCLVTDLDSRATVFVLKPSSPSSRVDDVSVDIRFGVLCALDAKNGFVTLYSLLHDAERPQQIDEPIKVDSGTYTGISARNGRLCVSGGDEKFTVVEYGPRSVEGTTEWVLMPHKSFVDVSLDTSGGLAFLSTHISGLLTATFGITAVVLDAGPEPIVVDILELEKLPTSNPPGATTPSGFPLTSVVSNDLDMLIVTYRYGVLLYNITDLMAIHELASFELGSSSGVACDVYENSTFVVSVDPPKITEIDLVDFKIVQEDLLQSKPTDIAVNDNFIVVAGGSQELLILERWK